MTTTFDLDQRLEQQRTIAALEDALRSSQDAMLEESRGRLAGVRLVPSGDFDARKAGGLTVYEAFALLAGVPADLRALAVIFDAAPAYELGLLAPYLAAMATAPDDFEARRRRAIRAFDAAVRKCLPAVFRAHQCREFSAELAQLPPIEERSLATAAKLLAIVEVQIDRRITEWFGRAASENPEAAALLHVRDDLILAARRYCEALLDGSFESIGPLEGPGFALAAAGQSAGWDEVSWWDFLGPMLELTERPRPLSDGERAA